MDYLLDARRDRFHIRARLYADLNVVRPRRRGHGAVFILLLAHLEIALQDVERHVHRLLVVLPELGAAVIYDPVIPLVLLIRIDARRALLHAHDGELRPHVQQSLATGRFALVVLLNAHDTDADDHARPLRDIDRRLRQEATIVLVIERFFER